MKTLNIFLYKCPSAKLLIFLIQKLYSRSQLSNTNFGHEFSKVLSMTYRQTRQIEFLSSFHVLCIPETIAFLTLTFQAVAITCIRVFGGERTISSSKNTILKSLNEYSISSNALFTHLGINASTDSVENPLAPATSCPK